MSEGNKDILTHLVFHDVKHVTKLLFLFGELFNSLSELGITLALKLNRPSGELSISHDDSSARCEINIDERIERGLSFLGLFYFLFFTEGERQGVSVSRVNVRARRVNV